jgi:hypothetical protein
MLTAPEHVLVQLSGTACRHTPLLLGRVFLAEIAQSHSRAVVCLRMPRGWAPSGAIFSLYELHVSSSTGSVAEALSEYGVVTE